MSSMHPVLLVPEVQCGKCFGPMRYCPQRLIANDLSHVIAECPTCQVFVNVPTTIRECAVLTREALEKKLNLLFVRERFAS